MRDFGDLHEHVGMYQNELAGIEKRTAYGGNVSVRRVTMNPLSRNLPRNAQI